MSGHRKTHRTCGAVAALLAGVALAGALAAPVAASTRTSAGWTIVPSASPGTISNVLFDVASLSPSEAWAVGSQISAPGDRFTVSPLIERFDGGAWNLVPAAPASQSNLASVKAFADDDVWAVGSRHLQLLESLPMVQHWDGSAWHVVPSPRIDRGNLFAVDGTSRHDLWAVGTVRDFHPRMLIEHFNGAAWSVVDAPVIDSQYVQLSGVSVLSSNDVWAVGYYLWNDGNVPFAVHYDGTSWRRFAIPLPTGAVEATLEDVDATNSLDAWAVGWSSGSAGHHRTFAVQWTGKAWRIVSMPSPGAGDELHAVGVDERGRAWGVGFTTDAGGNQTTLTERYRDGVWHLVPSPGGGHEARLFGVDVSGADVWTVGQSSPHDVGQSLTMRR